MVMIFSYMQDANSEQAVMVQSCEDLKSTSVEMKTMISVGVETTGGNIAWVFFTPDEALKLAGAIECGALAIRRAGKIDHAAAEVAFNALIEAQRAYNVVLTKAGG